MSQEENYTEGLEDDCAVLRAALEYDQEEVKRRLREFSLSELIYLRAACRQIVKEADDAEFDQRKEKWRIS